MGLHFDLAMKIIFPPCTRIFLLFFALFLFSCHEDSNAQLPKNLLGGWQGMTYGSSAYDPMFTMELKPNGSWRDLTFGQAKAINCKYKYDQKTKTLTLVSAKGSVLYKMKLEPATGSQKERLVEQTPANEYYRALVCYRYQIK